MNTTRVTTDTNGNVISRHDYKPFGEEIMSDVGNRLAIAGYDGVDGIRQKHTSYERDDETGLDFAKARYYSSLLGRFTSADPININQYRITNPQAWNKYSYVTNTPLKFTDPTGRIIRFRNEADAKKGLAAFQAGVSPEQRNAINIDKDKQGNFILKVDAKAAKEAGDSSLLGRLFKAADTPRIAVVDFLKKDSKFEIIRLGIASNKITATFDEANKVSENKTGFSGLTLFEFGDFKNKDQRLFNAAGANSAESGVTRILINTDSKDFTLTQSIYAETLSHFQTFAETGDSRKAIHPRVDQDEESVVNEAGKNENLKGKK